jgi:hypothetical protein
MLMLALPVQAQGGGSTVSFDGIGFSFDRSLGTGVNITQVRGKPSNNQGLDIPDAAHLAFAIHGRRSESAKALRAFDAPGVVRVYRVADLAGYDIASQRATQLKTLLADRPDLAGYMQVTGDGSVKALMPVFPAAQAIQARAQYIDTPQLAGVAYLTGFRQDVSPFAAGDFWYTFQGLSTDGTRYVSVSWIVRATMFPARIGAKAANRQANRWVKYLTESIATLNAAAPTAFTPPLTSIDALVQSITFEGVPASEPSPLPSLLPSPAPSPVASITG